MSNSNDLRVLGRVGARELTMEEREKITGSGHRNTHASQVPTGTVSSPDVDFDT